MLELKKGSSLYVCVLQKALEGKDLQSSIVKSSSRLAVQRLYLGKNGGQVRQPNISL